MGDGAVFTTRLFVYYDLLSKLVKGPGVEFLEVGILPDQREKGLHIVIDLFAGGDTGLEGESTEGRDELKKVTRGVRAILIKCFCPLICVLAGKYNNTFT